MHLWSRSYPAHTNLFQHISTHEFSTQAQTDDASETSVVISHVLTKSMLGSFLPAPDTSRRLIPWPMGNIVAHSDSACSS